MGSMKEIGEKYLTPVEGESDDEMCSRLIAGMRISCETLQIELEELWAARKES